MRVLRQGAAVDQVLSIGRPEGAGLDVFWIVRAGQKAHLFFLPVIPGQQAASGIKDLDEMDVAVIDAEKSINDTRRKARLLILIGIALVGRAHGCDHVAAVGRDLRHEAEALDDGFFAERVGMLFEGTPVDHILVGDGHLLIRWEPERKGLCRCAGRPYRCPASCHRARTSGSWRRWADSPSRYGSRALRCRATAI